MSTKSASHVNKNVPDISNSQSFAPTNQNIILQALLDNQRLMQDMQNKLHALSEENAYLKQNQYMSAPPNNDATSIASSTMMNQQQYVFYQQMIAASKAQQAFYKKSDLLYYISTLINQTCNQCAHQ